VLHATITPKQLSSKLEAVLAVVQELEQQLADTQAQLEALQQVGQGWGWLASWLLLVAAALC
jgi:hypothetical protein